MKKLYSPSAKGITIVGPVEAPQLRVLLKHFSSSPKVNIMGLKKRHLLYAKLDM